jgi:hypothetical protein
VYLQNVTPLIDMDALCVASGGNPGHIISMLKWHSLRTVRTLAVTANPKSTYVATTWAAVSGAGPEPQKNVRSEKLAGGGGGGSKSRVYASIDPTTDCVDNYVDIVTTALTASNARTSNVAKNLYGKQLVQCRAFADAATDIFTRELSHDAKLLACCLYAHAQHFDAAMCWSMSRRVFGNDMIRFQLAFNELLDVEWIRVCVHTTNDHLFAGAHCYCVSVIASLITPTTPAITEQELYDHYILHWVEQLIRIDEMTFMVAAGTRGKNSAQAAASTSFDSFGLHLGHFKELFVNIYSCGCECSAGLAQLKAQEQPLVPQSADTAVAASGNSGSSAVESLSSKASPVATTIINSSLGGSALSFDPEDNKRASEFGRFIHLQKTHLFQCKAYNEAEAAEVITTGSVDAFNQIRTEFNICYNVGSNVAVEPPSLENGKQDGNGSKDDDIVAVISRLQPRVNRVSVPVIRTIAKEIVGYASNILVQHFTPQTAVAISLAIHNILAYTVAALSAHAQESGSHGAHANHNSHHSHHRHHHHHRGHSGQHGHHEGFHGDGSPELYKLPCDISVIELAEQHFRAENFELGLKLMTELISSFYDVANRQLVTYQAGSTLSFGSDQTLPAYAARAMVCYGRLSLALFVSAKQARKAHQVLSKLVVFKTDAIRVMERYRTDGIAALAVAAGILTDSGLQADGKLIMDLRDEYIAATKSKSFRKKLSKLRNKMFSRPK